MNNFGFKGLREEGLKFIRIKVINKIKREAFYQNLLKKFIYT